MMCEELLYSSLDLFSTLGLVHDIVQHLHTHVDHSAIATRHTPTHTNTQCTYVHNKHRLYYTPTQAQINMAFDSPLVQPVGCT